MNRLDRQDCCVYHTQTSQNVAFAAARGGKLYAHAVLTSHFTLETLPTLHSRHTLAVVHTSKGTVVLLSTVPGLHCLCEHGLCVCKDMLATNSLVI